MIQTGLIDIVTRALGLDPEGSNKVATPAEANTLGSDPEGDPCKF